MSGSVKKINKKIKKWHICAIFLLSRPIESLLVIISCKNALKRDKQPAGFGQNNEKMIAICLDLC